MTAAAITKSDVRNSSLSAGTELDQLCINTIRTLAMDAVQQAKSGHPGTPMALAPLAYVIWQHFLRFDPEDPIWPNRDRFVLSNGHASMLLYAILHLSGVKAVNAKYERLGEEAVSLEDVKRFRQLGSKCPGHPEYHLTSGVETTTGPLGQGCGNSASAWLVRSRRWLAVQDPSLWRRLPHFLRLYETAHPVERPDGAASHFCVHARFHWGRRGWTHASAGGTT